MSVFDAHPSLPLPQLERVALNSLHLYTDVALFNQTSVRIAFTERTGGVSKPPYASLNLGNHVGDDVNYVLQNRQLLIDALDASTLPLLVPSQVHGTYVEVVESAYDATIERAKACIAEGADAVAVGVPQVAALLCFADCMPLIVVSPTGAFAVVHAGWRGVYNSIIVEACNALAQLDNAPLTQAAPYYNIYVGPYIHRECFETGADVHADFVQKFGEHCAFDETHIDLGAAVRTDLERLGANPARIADTNICSVCSVDAFFSYRAEDGVCGRHGALAFRKVA